MPQRHTQRALRTRKQFRQIEMLDVVERHHLRDRRARQLDRQREMHDIGAPQMLREPARARAREPHCEPGAPGWTKRAGTRAR